MLHDLLAKEDITILDNVKNWIEAVHICLAPLVKNGSVNEQYGKAIVKNIERYGDNFMITPYVVLPHARPEQGVNKNAISILLLKKPCYFNNSKMPIKLVIIMASIDSKSHLQILKSISNALNDEGRVNTVVNSNCSEDLYQKLMNV